MLPYCSWEVNKKEYRLKLTASAICKLEETFNKSLMQVVSEGEFKLNDMLHIIREAAQKYHPDITKDEIMQLYDEYIDAGGNQTVFISDIFMGVFRASGFFPEAGQ